MGKNALATIVATLVTAASIAAGHAAEEKKLSIVQACRTLFSNETEIAQCQLKLASPNPPPPRRHTAADPTAKTTPRVDTVAAHGAPPQPLAPMADPCNKRLFVRADPIDNRFYAVLPGSADDAVGASINYTDNRANSTQSAMLNGIVSYVVFGGGSNPNPKCKVTSAQIGQTYFTPAIAPWVSSSGTWNEPITKTENEALKGGVDFQLEIFNAGFFISQNYLVVSPFDQTDFRGTAHASGVDLAYEPMIPDIWLGFSNGPLVKGFLDGYWELRPEAEFRNVTSAGVTRVCTQIDY